MCDDIAAERAKDEGNGFFKAGLYSLALTRYSEAICRASPSNASLHIYYSNRAFTNTRLENLGLAVEDATRAVTINPQFAKAYYRRGCALVALGRCKDALKDFQRAAKLNPTDNETALRVKECKKEIQYQAFASAIVSDRTARLLDTIKPEQLFPVPDSYSGPRYPGKHNLTADWVKSLLLWLKAENVLHKQYAYRILLDVYELLTAETSLVRVPLPVGKEFTVCGDIHGQFYDLLNIFEVNGFPSMDNPYLFNGDFVDRGSFSVECVIALFALKLLLPGSFYLARGNHETKNMNRLYGFEGEVVAKYDDGLYSVACDVFCALPLAHVIGNAAFVVHGGLFSSDNVTLTDIEKIQRECEPADEGLMTELLWADPMPQTGRAASKRGVGLSFGPDVTARFLAKNNMQLVIRSHEMKEEGYEEEHGGKLVTVFSAPNYCDQMGNKGALIRLSLTAEGVLERKYTTFSSVPHPDKRAMCYANKMLFGPNMFGEGSS